MCYIIIMAKLNWTNEKRKLSELVPWPRNPRQINKAEAERLNESFETFDQVETIAIGPKNQIYNGHQRLNVWLDKYGPDLEVDVRVASRSLTEKEREKLVVFLHKGAVGEWNWDTLAKEFDVDDLIEWGFNEKELQIEGFTFGENGNAPEPQIDRAKELQAKWKVERDQIWEIGKHRLMCGDSMNEEDMRQLLSGKKADAIVTDPPYGQNQPGVPHDNSEEIENLIINAVHLLPCENTIIIAFQSPRTFTFWLDAIRKEGHKFERMLWLDKVAQCAFPWRGWILISESILVSTFGKGKWQDIHPYQHDIYRLPEVSGELSDNLGWHGSVKPLIVVADIIKRVSPKEGIIFDGFLGSGTTMVAAEQLNRICYGMEIEPKYCAVTLERMSDMGLSPRLQEDGKTTKAHE